MPLRASTAVVFDMVRLPSRVSSDFSHALDLLREQDACGGRLVMSLSDVAFGDVQVLPRHVERRVSHFTAERHNVATIPQEADCVLMSKIVRTETRQPGFLCVASELYGPCVRVPCVPFTSGEYRRRISPCFGANRYEAGKQFPGPVGEEDSPTGACLGCSGAYPYSSRGNVHV